MKQRMEPDDIVVAVVAVREKIASLSANVPIRRARTQREITVPCEEHKCQDVRTAAFASEVDEALDANELFHQPFRATADGVGC